MTGAGLFLLAVLVIGGLSSIVVMLVNKDQPRHTNKPMGLP